MENVAASLREAVLDNKSERGTPGSLRRGWQIGRKPWAAGKETSHVVSRVGRMYHVRLLGGREEREKEAPARASIPR